jgi:hypothetical protein
MQRSPEPREIRERLPKINRPPRSREFMVCPVAPIGLVTVDAVGVSEFSTAPFYRWSHALSRFEDEILFARKDAVDSRFRILCALFGSRPT